MITFWVEFFLCALSKRFVGLVRLVSNINIFKIVDITTCVIDVTTRR